MMQKGPIWLGSMLALATSAWAQLDLGHVYTQTVKTGQPWAAIETKIERVDLRLEINRGIATTIATLEYTPGNGQTVDWVCSARPCDRLDGKCEPDTCRYVTRKEFPLDSLETTFNFSQADNTALTDMYLWVGDTKVKAALQDRALASAQYEDIVKRRKDPALLETWGGGHYTLRIFPNESRQTRKIEVEFVQGLETSASAFRTTLPLLHSLTKVTSYGSTDQNSLPNRTVGAITLTAVAVDGNTYNLDWPGLGSGRVTGTPLKLSAANVAELKEGTLSSTATACAGCALPWVSLKGSASYFGVKALLEAKEMDFEDEPGERNFLLDVDGRSPDVNTVARARKVALLSLKAYGATPYVANLGLADGKGGIAYVFAQPAPMDEANLRKAYEALKAWTPSVDADAHATLKAYARSRGASAAPSVAFLINNDSSEYYSWQGGNWTPEVQARYEAWEKAKAAQEDLTVEALKGAKAVLIGFWNNWRLGRMATATGGFQVGSLYNYFYYGPVVTSADVDKPVDPLGNIHLPPLFGPGRPDAWTIADLKVTASGADVGNLTVLQENSFRGWWGRGPIMLDVIAKRSDYIAGPYRSPDSVDLRISGTYANAGNATFAISGLWGGLRFTKTLKAGLPSPIGASPGGAALWAYQRIEAWGRDPAADDIKAAQQLAREHHIVSRQTSLLALEPGMELWTNLPARDGQGSNSRVAEGGPAASDLKSVPGSASTVDNLSLEDVLNGTVGIQPPLIRTRAEGGLVARQAGAVLSLTWAVEGVEGPATFRILDLNGKVVADLRAVRAGSGYAAEWRTQGRAGAYFVVAKSGGRSAVRRILIRP